MIISRTPFRISFFGGGTDYPAWYLKNGGAVLATAIDKYCYITCRNLPPFFNHRSRIIYSKIELVNAISEIQHPAVRAVLSSLNITDGVEIHHDGDLPARSGIGSSSSFTVGLINALKALKGELISSEELAKQAIYIEQEVLKEHVGSQDQITAACGGFNIIKFSHGENFSIQPVIIDTQKIQALENQLMLFFTGFERYASEVAKAQLENLKNKEIEMNRIYGMVEEAVNILGSTNFTANDFGKLMHEAWMCKHSLSDRISNAKIDEIYSSACDAGATGGKILGAGGGGFLLLFVQPQFQECVRERLKKLIYVPFRFEPTGSRIVFYKPDRLQKNSSVHNGYDNNIPNSCINMERTFHDQYI